MHNFINLLFIVDKKVDLNALFKQKFSSNKLQEFAQERPIPKDVNTLRKIQGISGNTVLSEAVVA